MNNKFANACIYNPFTKASIFQYMNRSTEKHLGIRLEDAIGRTLQEMIIQDHVQVNTVGSYLLRTREWTGPLTLKKKNQETLVATCKAVPYCSSGR